MDLLIKDLKLPESGKDLTLYVYHNGTVGYVDKSRQPYKHYYTVATEVESEPRPK